MTRNCGLDRGQQLLHDRLAVRAVVLGIDRVRVVVIRRRVLQRHVDETRRVLGEPQLVELGAAAEAPRRTEREVPLDVVHRVVDLRVRVVVLRQQDRRAEKDRLPPPLREDLALDLDPLDHRGVRGGGDRRNDLVSHEPDRRRRCRVDPHLHRIAVEVSRRSLPVLAFPLVHVQPHRVAVRAREARVDVHERLHPVLAGRNVAQARDRMPAIVRADRDRGPGRELVDVFREERHPFRIGLLDGRPLGVLADREVHHAGDRLRAGPWRERDLHPGTRGRGLGGPIRQAQGRPIRQAQGREPDGADSRRGGEAADGENTRARVHHGPVMLTQCVSPPEGFC